MHNYERKIRMKKSNALMISYISFLVIALVSYFAFKWDGILRVSLAATIAGCLFAFADLTNWYISYRQPLVEAMYEDISVFEQYIVTSKDSTQANIELAKKVIEKLENDNTKQNQFGQDIIACKAALETMYEQESNLNDVQEDAADIKYDLAEDRVKVKLLKILEIILAVLRFTVFFVIISFETIVDSLSPYGSVVTIIAFAVIMLNYLLRDILEEKGERNVDELKTHMAEKREEIAEIEKETERINQHGYARKMADLIKESRIKETCSNG